MEEAELKVLGDVVKKSRDIEQLMYLINLNGIEHIRNYKLADLMRVQSVIKKCVRCGEYFLPNPNFLHHQVYCGIVCRNQASGENRAKYKLDEFQKPVDSLRKAIYERKYRALRDGKYYNAGDYDIILKKLSRLLAKRYKISKEEYFKQYNDLCVRYKEAVKKQKANT